MPTQTQNGKALEFAFLKSLEKTLSNQTNVMVINSPQLRTTQTNYLSLPQETQQRMSAGADAGINTIIQLEPRLIKGNGSLQLSIQPDSAGQAGDVRDVIGVRSTEGWEIGISCKNNHAALKHSRLSATIDIGDSWFGYNSTRDYFNQVIPIFDELNNMRTKGMAWSQIPDKVDSYYVPVLNALIEELWRLDRIYPGQIPQRLLTYLLGRFDFYKAIVKTRSRTTEIQGFNLQGTLNQGANGVRPTLRMPHLRLPSRFYDIHFKPGSDNTILIVCDEGWTISARVHNASSRVEPSLKLDVQLVGLPPTIFRQTLGW
ncbi:HaeIII family restriction endonuclease [Heyndrickxia oleronia]|uniref:HaeIII family restriction endonuclease n=1 Tax=Heyndrickxia oleronia TaxID=38875 RepID=A0AAW6T088_9BACI|nr:HaeIII family restriction endonuclease [Heyndrickxia oleronia]MDH5163918.1 HaeIII family restriction endonuclease [Heyndrickxia oleronia]